MAVKVLDVTGKMCPIPVMKTAKAIADIASGSRLEVLATDPGAVDDMQVFCQTKGHLLVEQTHDDGVFRFVIQKSGG